MTPLVSNTSPLIALARLHSLSLAKALFGEVLIPSAVHQELLAKAGPDIVHLNQAFGDFIRVLHSSAIAPHAGQLTGHLGAGEQQAIALALDVGALLLIDDRSGRAAAHALGLKVTGTAGLLVLAKEAGLVQQVRPLLEELRRRGYYLSMRIMETTLKLAGE